jgi:Transglutaminase-like superfamily
VSARPAVPDKAPRKLRSPGDVWLAVRMTGWALVLPLLKHAVSLPRLARLMWRRGSGEAEQSEIDHVVRLSWAAARIRPLPGRDNCLERSLIAYRYLSALGARPQLVVALRSAREAPDGHVWVTIDGRPVGGEDVSPFTPLFELGPHGEQLPVTPA